MASPPAGEAPPTLSHPLPPPPVHKLRQTPPHGRPEFPLISPERDPSAAATPSPRHLLASVHGGDAIGGAAKPHWKMGGGREDATMVVGREKRRSGSGGRPRGRRWHRWKRWRGWQDFYTPLTDKLLCFFSINFRAVKDGVVTICAHAGGWVGGWEGWGGLGGKIRVKESEAGG